MAESILIVESNSDLGKELVETLTRKTLSCEAVSDEEAALNLLAERDFDLVIADLQLNGLQMMEWSRQVSRNRSFILTTAVGSMETAIEALRQGALDYLVKPLSPADLADIVTKFLEHRVDWAETRMLRQEMHAGNDYSSIVGTSPAIRALFAQMHKVVDADSPVIITGKSGTGKELVAKSIHFNSRRRTGRFVALNCSAITETLFESELFGHLKGAFTGAVADREGFFKAADGGTLFLDEISELSLNLQAKLLRAIENRTILPVGSTVPEKVNVRIIAATNRELPQQVRLGLFRRDLYYRLNVVELHLPSLSERRQDIPLLVRHFIEKYNRQMNRSIRGVEPRLMQWLINREYKGHVRELENLIERLMIFAMDDELTMDALPAELREPMLRSTAQSTWSLKSAVEEFERFTILQKLQECDYHRAKTARKLGIGEATLYRKMKDLGIDKCDSRLFS
ncbi:sigma-54-dependent Fis family transcriptional regulator [candidate division KSB1 bacterium]|nr:sigma-54-dependent Fis family transcriptional regulator [candidate division KSB1 bacterium]